MVVMVVVLVLVMMIAERVHVTLHEMSKGRNAPVTQASKPLMNSKTASVAALWCHSDRGNLHQSVSIQERQTVGYHTM